MVRIIDYPETQELKTNDVFLIDGDNGNKKISTEALMALINNDLGGTIVTDQDSLFALLDPIIPVPMRRNLFRGKNLGSAVTDDQYNHIGDGTFRGLFLGDYWKIEGRIWRIVDFDYWLGRGNCRIHHLVIMPDSILYSTKMNDTDTTSGGYVGSKMYTTNLENAKTIVNSTFGENHILNHREYLTNAVTNGHPSGCAWFDSTIELPNEIMMYGCYIFAPAGDGSFVSTRDTVNYTQLALMQYYSTFINQENQTQWLRDIASGNSFVLSLSINYPTTVRASQNGGVRPVFGLRKA